MTLPDSDLIVFDGECVFCSEHAHFVTRHDKARRFLFVTVQSETGRELCKAHGINPDDPESNVVIIGGRAFLKMRAFTEVLKTLGWPWKAFAVIDILPRPVNDWIYDRIARNRYRFGGRRCRMPTPELKARLIE